jgi:hypothetical protein
MGLAGVQLGGCRDVRGRLAWAGVRWPDRAWVEAVPAVSVHAFGKGQEHDPVRRFG